MTLMADDFECIADIHPLGLTLTATSYAVRWVWQGVCGKLGH